MAFGADTQGGGVFAFPEVPQLGYDTWAEMSGMSPGHPLVGGVGGGTAASGAGSLGTRQVALAQPNPTAAAASGAPVASHWSQLFNLSGNPVGWVLIVLLLYLVLTHLHLRAGARAGARLGK